MKCVITGCCNEAISKVTWIGEVKWSGYLCKFCIEEMWEKNIGLVMLGLADVIFDKIEQ